VEPSLRTSAGGSIVSTTIELGDYDFDVTCPDPMGLSTASGGEDVVRLFYVPGAVGSSQRFDFTGSSTGLASADLYATRLTVYPTAVAPVRASTYVLAPLDYSGLYNVTDTQRNLVSRRYVGEPRFVAILLNEMAWLRGGFNCWCGPTASKAFLVPRSVFFETRLNERLNESKPVSPLDRLTFRQNDTSASSKSDDLQAVLSGNVMSNDWLAILDLLTLNATNAEVRAAIALTNDLFLYPLPDDGMRFVEYDS
jgi:hypothetical protein